MGSQNNGRLKNKKPCARRPDAARCATSASGDPAMVFGFRMASILSLRSRAPCPLSPAAGLLRDVRIEHETFVFHARRRIDTEGRCRPSTILQKTRGNLPRAYSKTSATTNVVCFEQRL